MPRMPRDSVQRGQHRNPRRRPHQEYLFNALQAFIQRLGNGQISTHGLNLRREPGIGLPHQSPYLRARIGQLRDNPAANGSGSANHKDTAHTPSYTFRTLSNLLASQILSFLIHAEIYSRLID